MRSWTLRLVITVAALASGCADPMNPPSPASGPPENAVAGPGARRYTITDLGTLPGGTFSQASFAATSGRIVGVSDAPDGTQHAVLWTHGRIVDLATAGLGGPNSFAVNANDRGDVVGQAEGAAEDPNHENFCAYGTGLVCLPFLWRDGAMRALPTLGGYNGTVGSINGRGQVAGMAETDRRDAECPTTPAVNGTGPQLLDYEAVIWGPGPGEVRALPPLPGDHVAMAFWVNDRGQAVGASGSCANTLPPPFAVAPHAVLWDADGSVHDLGTLGGTGDRDLLGVGNVAFAINDRGQAVGVSALPGNVAAHGFLWSEATGMQSLEPLPGDPTSAALALNDRGDVVGASQDGPTAASNARAVIWHDGVVSDLNELVDGATSLYLLTAFGIDNAGRIVGFAFDTGTFQVHAFLASPTAGRAGVAAAGPTHAVTRPDALPTMLGVHLRRGFRLAR